MEEERVNKKRKRWKGKETEGERGRGGERQGEREREKRAPEIRKVAAAYEVLPASQPAPPAPASLYFGGSIESEVKS